MELFSKVRALALVAPVAVMSHPVFAAVPADVTTALGDAKTDVATVAGAVLVIAIALVAFLWMRRAAK